MFEDFVRWFVGAPPPEEGDEEPVAAPTDGRPEERLDMSEFDPSPDAADGETDEDSELTVEDLEYRVGELETDLERIENATKATRRGQEDVAASVEDLEATVRRLLGVYDRLTNDTNPFVDDGSFGVVGDGTPDPTLDGSASRDGTGRGRASDGTNGRERGGGTGPPDSEGVDGATPDDEERDDGGVETVSFEDLKRASEAAPDADAGTVPGVDAEATTTVPPKTPVVAPTPGSTADEALLDSLAEGYAADVVVFEWLSMLVGESGPAGALKALDYYQRVGWISADVREHLEGVLGGPAVDADVDPREPRDLTASHHAESYDYATELRTLEDVAPEGLVAEE